jgi:histidinol dehydrogenase
MARVRGGLSVNDFVKLITVQEYSAQALRIVGPHAVLLAEAEGLTAHAEAIRTRLKPPAVGQARLAPPKNERKDRRPRAR